MKKVLFPYSRHWALCTKASTSQSSPYEKANLVTRYSRILTTSTHFSNRIVVQYAVAPRTINIISLASVDSDQSLTRRRAPRTTLTIKSEALAAGINAL